MHEHPADSERRRPLRFGIDGEALRAPLSGVGQYVYNLCLEIEKQLPDAEFLVYSRLAAARLALPSSRWVVRRETRPALRRLPSFLWLKTRGAALCRADVLDVFWAGRTIHPGRDVAGCVVVTVHDFNHRLVPKTMEAVTLWSHRWWFESDIRSAHVVTTNSYATERRMERYVARRADAVVQPGLAAHFAPLDDPQRSQARDTLSTFGVTGRYLLAVSTLEPRKNLESLIDAFNELRRSQRLPDHQLLLVGARGWPSARLARKLEDAARNGVLVAGYVPDAMMPALYGLADLLVMPSIYEGFGMPVLEARSMGTPVLTSDLPELRESAGGEAHVTGLDAQSIANGIVAALAAVSVPSAPTAGLRRWSTAAASFVASLQPLRAGT